MNKVININFQGRVIPIEEPAYEELKKYVESLRQYFINEEGREEIINDIENRIAELFNEKLKISGVSFISEAHVEAIIASMGRPEQFEEPVSSTSSTPSTPSTSSTSLTSPLYRNANEKILGGVCSGIAAYFKIDTTIIRVLFAMLAVGSFGFGLLLYIVLWVILPERYLSAVAVTRKLYRDPEQKVLGGVSSGLAHYFNIQVWIPRLIFAIPFIASAVESIFNWVHFSGAFSLPVGTWFLIYVILWAVVPKAVTASERMEMKGEKIDLESIKNKVKEEMSEVKSNLGQKADKWKTEFGSKAAEMSQEARESAQRFAGQTGPAFKKSGNRFVRLLVSLLKVFLFFIGGIIAISLIAAAIGILGVGNSLMPLKNFLVQSQTVQWYAWATLILFIIVPIVGVLQWIIRSIIGHKTRRPVIGITLSVLWILGWVALVMLVSTIANEFRRMSSVKSEVTVVQPSTGKLKINFSEPIGKYYPLDLLDGDFDMDGNTGGIRLSENEDSLLISNIKIHFEKSTDDQFHVSLMRRSRGENTKEAEIYASRIDFPITQQDSVLLLPNAFPINDKDKFHNQQVIVEVKVPIGKEIFVDRKSDQLQWYSIKGGRNGISVQEGEDESGWQSSIWYIMTENGLEKKYKNQLTEEEAIDELEKKLRENIKKENMKVEDMDIKITDKDTIVNINVGEIKLGEQEEEQPSADRFSSGRKLILGTMRLLKINS
jgi:phage shock protein PspC (stress-responsive transcriptional regulator)